MLYLQREYHPFGETNLTEIILGNVFDRLVREFICEGYFLEKFTPYMLSYQTEEFHVADSTQTVSDALYLGRNGVAKSDLSLMIFRLPGTRWTMRDGLRAWLNLARIMGD